jgi:hypothetical protein
MKASRKRLILRCVHLIVAIPVIGYVYQPASEAEQYAAVTRYGFFPLVILSGYWMYGGFVFAILGAAAWIAASYVSGFGAALLSQIVLFVARKIWMMTRKRPSAVAEPRTQ